jgi:hypothetical protein
MSSHPARTAFDQVERLVGRPLERLAGAPETSYVTMALGRTWMFGMRRLEDLRSTLVHVWALPSHRDVRLLSTQVARLQRGIEEIEQRLDDRDLHDRNGTVR